MIVGIAAGAESRLLAADVALKRAFSIVHPFHTDFDDALRADVADLINSATRDISGARYEIARLTRAPSVFPANIPRSCPGCERVFVERAGVVACCIVCTVMPGWRAKTAICELVHPGLAPKEP